MARTLKIGGSDIPVYIVDRYYRAHVLGMTIDHFSESAKFDAGRIARHEAGHYSIEAHDAYYRVGGYEALLNNMPASMEADIVAYAAASMTRGCLLHRYEDAPDDALSMTDAQFDDFCDAACALMAAC